MDTGIRADHTDFSGRVQGGATAIDDGNGTNDCQGHGTHVAGTVGGEKYGVAKDTTLVPVRVLGCDGRGPSSGVIAGMDWVAENASGPSVVNMSLGGGASDVEDAAVKRLTDAGVVVVTAAGNDTDNACNYSPGRAASAINVGSTNNQDGLSWFSNYGSCVDILAPGSDILSASHASSTGSTEMSGTSMASPHVAGAAALYLGKNPNATVAQVTEALTSSATPNAVSGVNGSPNLLLNTTALLGAPAPTPEPEPTPGSGIVNGDFEDGSQGWSGDTWAISSFGYPAAGGYSKLWLGGAGYTSQVKVQQALTIPAGSTALDFELGVDTDEWTSYSAHDTMEVRLLDASGNELETLGTWSNLDSSRGYETQSLDISDHAGQQVVVEFASSENSGNQTSFLVDDVATR
ncbi:S8 family peptidase [Kytococcus aerolatus]|uniref:S8 family peptidase n=1 Tax=Kytococcus aerolatus TaxID=592308 RepID=UPI002285D927|nr:S8 family peptidase [Kytococcus aerolatus]